MPEEEIRHVVLPNTELFIAYKFKETIGFAASRHKKDEVYLAAAVISPSERGKGLYHVFNRIRIEHGLDKKLTNITTRTQNPRVERRITEVMDMLVIEHKINKYVINRELLKGIYGRMLTDSRPTVSDPNINNVFSRLNYERGDAYFITFSVQLVGSSQK